MENVRKDYRSASQFAAALRIYSEELRENVEKKRCECQQEDEKLKKIVAERNEIMCEKTRLIKQAEELNLINVVFIPPVPKEEMPEALAAADACIAILKPIPMYATVYPNKVFDYMAAGRPVILAIEGVIKDVVEQAKAGLAIPPGNSQAIAQAVIMLFNDQAKAKKFGQNGRMHVSQHYNRRQLATRMLEIMQQLKQKNN